MIWAAKTRITFGDLVHNLLRDTRSSCDKQGQRLKSFRKELLPTVLNTIPSIPYHLYKKLYDTEYCRRQRKRPRF